MTNQLIELPGGSTVPVETLKFISYAGIGMLGVGMIGKTIVFVLRCRDDDDGDSIKNQLSGQEANGHNDSSKKTGKESSGQEANRDIEVLEVTMEQSVWINYLTQQTVGNCFACLEIYDFACKIAKLPKNTGKNRYKNVLPYDDNRVTIPGDGNDSVYINASPIKIGNHNLIASQGPLENTCADHWSMIWHQKVTLISMVTGFVEWSKDQLKNKCFEYLPLEPEFEAKTFERKLSDDEKETFIIKCTEVQEGKNKIFTQRTLMVTYKKEGGIYQNLTESGENGSSETRKIQHLQFNAWPDKKAPKKNEFKEYFIEFLKLMKNAPGIDLDSAKTLVHCSAGVGRTGTLLTFLQLLIKLYKKDFEPKTLVDVINKLREQRVLIVQSDTQFKFICNNFEDFAEVDEINKLIESLENRGPVIASESNTLI